LPRFVVDAPTLLHLVDEGLTVDPAHQLVAPGSIRSEALELLLGQVVRGERDEASVRSTHERMTEVRIRLLGDRVSRMTSWTIARERGWDTLRDAEYLAVARLQADALVSIDPELVAKADGVVAVAPLSALLGPDRPTA
jgi:predicted nucleic acid-binding protein